jgi:hypothetical protein
MSIPELDDDADSVSCLVRGDDPHPTMSLGRTALGQTKMPSLIPSMFDWHTAHRRPTDRLTCLVKQARSVEELEKTADAMVQLARGSNKRRVAALVIPEDWTDRQSKRIDKWHPMFAAQIDATRRQAQTADVYRAAARPTLEDQINALIRLVADQNH